MKKVSVYMEDDLHRKAKVHCAEQESTLQEFVSGAVGVALDAVKNPAPDGSSQRIALPLTERQKNRYLRSAARLLRCGNPVVVDYLKATIQFHYAMLNLDKEQQPQT